MASGLLRQLNPKYSQYEDVLDLFSVPSRHLTFVFNTFYLMQVLNLLFSHSKPFRSRTFTSALVLILTSHYLILTLLPDLLLLYN